LFLFGIACGDGRTYVLSLEGDGSATVIVDEVSETAYIHDGGRAGEQGIAGARIDGKFVLDFLTKKEIKTLVISCSHPHEDHMAGLETLLERPEITRFENLYFVDAIQDGATTRSGKPIKPLYKTYEDKWPGGPPPHVDHKSASGADAFASLNLKPGDVSVHNYKYDPGSAGEDVHDNSVIVEIEVRGPKSAKRTLVDFDDASTELIKQWASGKPPRSANALLMAHHGSRYNDMSAVLKGAEGHGLTDIIFTANNANKFLHPTPEALRMALEAVGPDHVHITGSAPGDFIELSPEGRVVRSKPGEARSRLEGFLSARIADVQERLKTTDSARNRLRYADDLVAIRAIRDDLSAVGGSTRSEENGVAAFASRMAMTHADQVHSENARKKNEQVPMGVANADAPNAPDAGISGGPGRTPPAGDAGIVSAPMAPGPNGSHGTSGGFSGSGGSGGGGFAPPSYRNFRTTVAETVAIRFGGVVIGNEPKGVAISDLQFIRQPGPGTVSVQITATDGTIATFGPMSTTQLWAAYNFVAPTKYLREKYPGVAIEADAGGLAGMDSRGFFGWNFALNPAIADTSLAKDAMRLDMALALAHSDSDAIPKAVRLLPWTRIGKYATYQWFDEQASISTAQGNVTIANAKTHGSCLMQLRLLTSKSDEVIFKADEVSNDDSELLEAVKKVADNHLEASSKPYSEDKLAEIRQAERVNLAKQRAVARSIQALPDQTDLTEDERYKLNSLAVSQIRGDAGLIESLAPPDVTSALCEGLPFLRRIDQLAKTVALFHRYLDTAHKPLPELPGSFVPKFINVDAQMGYEEVWEDFAPVKRARAE